MKKLMAVLLVLMMAVSAVAFAEGTDVLGDWYGGAFGGIPLTLTIYDDGTALLKSSEYDADATWTMENGILTVTAGENALPLTVGEGTLTNEEQQASFTREAPAALPAFVVAEDVAAFNGTWNMGAISAFGEVVGAEMLQGVSGSEALLSIGTMTIENGKVTVGEETKELAFQEGQLVYTPAEDSEIEMPINLVLCDNGDIGLSTMNGMIVIYFTPAAAE